jgi:20S proteasome subunit beta 2
LFFISASWEPFTSLGSGSLNAISVLEAKFRDGLTEVEAIALCTEAIEAGIIYDLGYFSFNFIFIILKIL